MPSTRTMTRTVCGSCLTILIVVAAAKGEPSGASEV